MHSQHKMQQQIRDEIAITGSQQISGRLGVIISYDDKTNTATVAITKQQSDEIDELITNVLCPRTLGVQSAAPLPGLQCWVVFKDNNITQPLITQYYNYKYYELDYAKQTKSVSSLPNYLLGL